MEGSAAQLNRSKEVLPKFHPIQNQGVELAIGDAHIPKLKEKPVAHDPIQFKARRCYPYI